MQEHPTESDRIIWLQTIEEGLAANPCAVPLLFERAKTLDTLGDERAEAAYRAVLAQDERHFAAWNDLGLLLSRDGQYFEATSCFRKATLANPNSAIGHANLGYLLHRGGEVAAAVQSYHEALRCDPNNIDAHRGLSIALSALGREDQALEHRQKGFISSPITTLAYHGSKAAIPILLLVSASAANVPLERLISTRCFLVHKIVVEFAHTLEELPPHRLIINAVGDVDASAQALIAARNCILRSSAPVINHPDAIAETGRVDNALRFERFPGIRTPRVRKIDRHILVSQEIEQHLASLNLGFPLLLRSLGYHTGEHFLLVNTVADIAPAVRKLPGGDLLAMEYIDVQNENLTYTKYRMMIVGPEMYPLHAAISHDWKVHYFSAAMKESAQYRAFDANFLEDPLAILGQEVISGLASIAHTMALDYGGIDFSLDRNGSLVLFEANATMVIVRPGPNSMWDYRRTAVGNIESAFHELLLERAERGSELGSLQLPLLVTNTRNR